MLEAYTTYLKDRLFFYFVDAIYIYFVCFFQGTHLGDDNGKFWKNQRGDQIYPSHASTHSAGVAILFNLKEM